MSTNIQMLKVAVEHLEPLLEEVVFVGGATIELWITDPLAPSVRATADVDVIVEVSTRRDYYRFVRDYISRQFEKLSLHDLFDSGLEGALPAGPEVRERVDDLIWPRVRELVELQR